MDKWKKKTVYQTLRDNPNLEALLNFDFHRISLYHKEAIENGVPPSVIKTGLDAHFRNLLNKYNIDVTDLEVLRILYNHAIEHYNWLTIR